MKNAVGVSDLDWGRHEAIGNIMDHFSKALHSFLLFMTQ